MTRNILIFLIVRELFNKFVNGQFQYSKVSILVLLFSLNVLLGTIGNAIIEIVGEKSVYELKTKLIDGIEHLRIRVAQDYNTNETVNHVVNDTEILGEVISSTLLARHRFGSFRAHLRLAGAAFEHVRPHRGAPKACRHPSPT